MSTLVLIFRQHGANNRFHATIPTVVITEKDDDGGGQKYEVVTKKTAHEVVRIIISDVNTLLMYINVLANTTPFLRIDVCAKDVFPERTSIFNNPRAQGLLSQCVYIWSLTASAGGSTHRTDA